MWVAGSDNLCIFCKADWTVLVHHKLLSKFIKRHSKAKCRAPAYSRALREIRSTDYPKDNPWEAQVRLPEGERFSRLGPFWQGWFCV